MIHGQAIGPNVNTLPGNAQFDGWNMNALNAQCYGEMGHNLVPVVPRPGAGVLRQIPNNQYNRHNQDAAQRYRAARGNLASTEFR